jgi:very-short-patch-repair endonuclease
MRGKLTAVTGISRTLFDLAAVVARPQFERALNEAEILGLTDSLSLRQLLSRYPRRPGARAVRAALDAGTTLTRSELESRFLAFLRARRLPRPETNVPLNAGGYWIECDCVWRRSGVVVELDGRAFHDTARAFERDRERDRRLQAAGWRVVRVTWRQLADSRDGLEADLRSIFAAGPSR